MIRSLITLILLALVPSAAAQDIKYEVIRTAEVPGYFALRVYPGEQLPPLAVQTVFVENYTNKSERRRYKKLTQSLRQSGNLVLTAQQAVDYTNDDRYRLVLLGGPTQSKWLQFKAPLGADTIPLFETFTQTKLGPVYLMNLNADFGGNVQQVRPDTQPFLNDQSTYFVGQFNKPMKTLVSLSGETPDVTLQADGVMDLSTFKPHQASGVLEKLWQDLNPTAEKFSFKNLVTDAFPLLLVIFGLSLMYLASRPSKLRTGMAAELDDEFWHTPLEETPLYQAWEKSHDWALSDEELRQMV